MTDIKLDKFEFFSVLLLVSHNCYVNISQIPSQHPWQSWHMLTTELFVIDQFYFHCKTWQQLSAYQSYMFCSVDINHYIIPISPFLLS